MKNAKKVGVIFTIVGVFLFIVMFTIVFITNKKRNELTGRVRAYSITWDMEKSKDSIVYRPTYYYKVGTKSYSCKSDFSSSNKKADPVVYFDIEKPEKCLTDFDFSINKLFLIFLTFPSFFILLGLIFIVIDYLNSLKRNEEILDEVY